MSNKVKNIPDIITNKANLYEGDLEHYLRVVFSKAQNLWFPYHNFRHMLHMTWMTYQACEFYQEELLPNEIRCILIAALFHDFDHSGMLGEDDLNIERANRALAKNILPQDETNLPYIQFLLTATQFPPLQSVKLDCSLPASILRDADLSQAFNPAWIQQVVFGLSAEWRKLPIEVLKMQKGFLSSIAFRTEWAKELFTPEVIKEKIEEATALLQILEKEETK